MSPLSSETFIVPNRGADEQWETEENMTARFGKMDVSFESDDFYVFGCYKVFHDVFGRRTTRAKRPFF